MFRRHIPLLTAAVCVLVLASAAAAAPNRFTATLGPQFVKPQTTAPYTLSITNASTSDEVDRATVTIPPGFTVVEPVFATTTAASACEASIWEADGTLISDGRINLKPPGGGGNQNLCPGGVLTISFYATSPSASGPYTWIPDLLADGQTEFFTFTGDTTVDVDGDAPETTIEKGPPTVTNQRSAQFTFTSSEPGTTFECKLDGSAFASCPSPKDYSSLGAGPHTFEVRAVDRAGNVDASPASSSWTIDLAAPETTITSFGPPTPTNETGATFTFESTEPESTFACSISAVDDGAFAPCTSPVTYAGLAGGDHTFQVRATDPAGNTDESPASRDWRIDLIGPATTVLQGPPGSTNSSFASFLFESVEPVSTFECSLDGELFTACRPPAVFGGLSDGPHTFAVRAVDPASNAGPAATHSWTVDTRPPGSTIIAGPPGLTNNGSATFEFSASEPASFQCQLDSGGLVPCGSPIAYEGLADGTHTFVVRPTDAVGNPGAAASYTWVVDRTAPETTLGSRPRTSTTVLSATFTFSATEAAAFQCRLDGAAPQPCASPKSYAGLKRSVHTFEVRAVDPAGNIDPSPAVHRWTIGGAPRRAAAASALLAPRAGTRVTRPPLLRWRSVRRASYYNVQLYRGRVKILSAWPTRPRLQLRGRWTHLGRRQQLTSGAYRWYVWPSYGRGSARRYGRLVGESTFIVTATSRR